LLDDDAAGTLEQARILSLQAPCRRGTRRLLVLALAHAGEMDAAVSELEKTLALYPDDSETCYDLAIVFRGVNRLDESLDLFRRAHRINPIHELAKCGEGQVLAMQGHIEAATRAFREAIAINPLHPTPYESLDAMLAAQCEPGARVSLWREMVAGQASCAQANLHLGKALEAAGDSDGSLAAYRRAVELDPFDHSLRSALNNALGIAPK